MTATEPATTSGRSADLLTLLAAATGDPGLVRHRLIDRLAHAHDASHFLLTPRAVVSARSADEVGKLFAAAGSAGVPLGFRSGGTSLSGQGGTDGVLVDTRRHFRDIEVLDDGARVRVGPGATIRQVNARLARLGRKLGPDPASEVACTVGGVVANNSSGMACGTWANSYATLESMVLVLPSGTVVDTGRRDADERLRAAEPELHAGLSRLRDRVRDDAVLRKRIEQQFSMKNTMGYGLNSLLDHTAPADILAHLAVGSEGTLAFIASVVLRTVPLHGHARTGLLVFDDLAGATGALPALVATGPATIELLDATSLRVGQRDAQATGALRDLAVDRHAALLIEYQAATAEEVDELAGTAGKTLAALPIGGSAALSADAATRAGHWHVRKGLYAMIAGARPSGTTALLEDIVVPVPELLPTCEALTGLFATHGYHDSVIFGHAKDGNIHFMLTEQLGGGGPLDRFAAFTDDMVDLVLGRGGSLKAEHGTGRMMAPFVRRQYGDELYEVMVEIKRLCDPRDLLNPGVLIAEDPSGHLRNLKASPRVEEEVDRCVECGFCEPVCPSRDLTTTPRQRIVLRREIERAREAGDTDTVARLRAEYDYDAVQTCAVDGMCQTACPVTINTGDLMKRLRAEDAGRAASALWAGAARHWDGTTRAAATALTTAAKLPRRLVLGANELARKTGGTDAVPLWSPELPRGGRRRTETAVDNADAVLFASCTGTMFGSEGDGAAAALRTLCERAGVRLTTPAGLPSLCCGTPWKSKGLDRGHDEMARRVLPALWSATRGGEIPVIGDASSCTEGLRHLVEGGPEHFHAIRVVDAVEFVRDSVLPHLTITAPAPAVALHPTCSATRLGLAGALRALTEAVAGTVTVPDEWGCCGFAGDRGLLHPELTASATARQARELAAAGPFDAHVSCNRTCELGLTRATGERYEHVLELVERATRG
ncbi:FAD-binding and (Fe-S)-binding domain-containing protein [Amycolatopsis rhabdoformis]|uniref:D-lactate dehydrogenase (cytochrome) n=1 Tax=Amycolatopsis rhabdoformis TaxID=1448059 RepID=A0ABZ1IDS6_9PSEU|nr:FAD-binding and (Fe-S)-binding domain-containing protein [Amycolatopsis rhabdoformis]WSE32600.1 FAD-binding and (Fe-S)-binding domain-containing protein [Amycolatopsis rhabdoformis]